MLRPVKDLKGYALLATDGPIGHVVDVLVDDRHWAVRYLVVDTGTWLSGRRVLISPMSLGRPDWALQQLPVSLTKDRVEHSPDVDTQKPVSRQHEEEQLSYYGYPVYWEGTGLWGTSAYPGMLAGTATIASKSGVSTATSATSRTYCSTMSRGPCGISWSTRVTGGVDIMCSSHLSGLNA